MPSRDSRIRAEAAALWQAMFGEPPPPDADGASLLDMLTRSLPDENYVRLRSPFLRPSTIVGPGFPGDESALS